MITIKIKEDFILDNFCYSFIADKLFSGPQVTLLHVCEIRVDNELDLIIHLVLQDALDGWIIQFCHLDDSMSYFPPFAIPISDEIFGLVHIPMGKIIMELNPVFTKFSIDILAFKPGRMQ